MSLLLLFTFFDLPLFFLRPFLSPFLLLPSSLYVALTLYIKSKRCFYVTYEEPDFLSKRDSAIEVLMELRRPSSPSPLPARTTLCSFAFSPPPPRPALLLYLLLLHNHYHISDHCPHPSITIHHFLLHHWATIVRVEQIHVGPNILLDIGS